VTVPADDGSTPGGAARRGAIVARAPARLDFGGGWTDVPPYSDEQGGCVCNVAIARHATVVLAPRGPAADATLASVAAAGRRERDTRLADAALRRSAIDGVSVASFSDFPVSAGLGGSSATGVALAAAAAAWRGALALGDDMHDERRAALAEASRAVEVEEVGIAGGRQDHYAAAFGGALRLDFGAWAGGLPARATRIALDARARAALERRCVVVYTGESRVSGSTVAAVLDAYRAREPRVVAALARMRALAVDMADALARGDVDALGALLAEHWTHQRALHPSITTPRIEALVERGARAGALGAKALGASGGGCVLLLAAEGREAAVRAAAAELGEVLDIALDLGGVRVEPLAAPPRAAPRTPR
jgi:D-glycero-alpha-D-manno-heptose-7-phosphate kinase